MSAICFVAGMLWTGQKPEAKAMEDTMTSYFNTLQGFLLHSHGSTVGAGPTLSSCIHASVKQVVDSSFKLMKEFVALYGNPSYIPSPSEHFLTIHWLIDNLFNFP